MSDSFLFFFTNLMLLGTTVALPIKNSIEQAIKEAVPPSKQFLQFTYKAVSDVFFDSEQACRRN